MRFTNLDRAITNQFKGSRYLIDYERNLVVACGTPEQLDVMDTIIRDTGFAASLTPQQSAEAAAARKLTPSAPTLVPQTAANQRVTSGPVASNDLAERPTLRFLAWRDEWQTNQPGAAWHPDGSPVTNPTELNWLRQVKPADPKASLIDFAPQVEVGTNLVKLPRRPLYLWFSYPSRTPIAFDRLSLGIPTWGPEPAATSSQEPNYGNGGLGWSTACLLTRGLLNIPPRLTVALEYTAGPLERVKDVAITPGLVTPIPVDDGAAVKGYGQDDKERAFIAIAVDAEKIWSRRFDVIAVAKDGREITSIPRVYGDTAKPASGVVKFEFNLPVAEVAKFRIGSRPIRTRQWSDVVMAESKQDLYGDTRQRPPAKKSQSSSLSQPESLPGVPLLIQGRPIADWVKEAEISVRPGKEGERALRVLENAGPPIMPQLGRLLVEDKSPEIQAKAALAMSVIGYHNPDAPEVHSAVPVLTTAAQNKSSEVRIYSVQALGAIGRAASNAVPVLIRLTRDENDGVRMSAVEALGRIGATSPESVEALTAAASDASSDVRITARKALIVAQGGKASPLMTSNEAGSLAEHLANEKAQALYNCQPFRNSPPARFVRDHWTWHRLKAQGLGDIEATVELAADGAEPKVTVVRLVSIPRTP